MPFLSFAWILMISTFCAAGLFAGGAILGRKSIGITAAVGLTWLDSSSVLFIWIERRLRAVGTSVVRLLSQFSLSKAECFAEEDRALVTSTVVELFGTAEAFDMFVQQVLAPKLSDRVVANYRTASNTGALLFLWNYFGCLVTMSVFIYTDGTWHYIQ
eukprot:COSAG03_NODE_9499_length_715_cov_0.759740_1_plen_158_part_01